MPTLNFLKWGKNKAAQSTVMEFDRQDNPTKPLLNRLSLITQSAGIGIWDWEFSNNKLHWDDRMKKLYGLPEESSMYSFEEWNAMIHPDEKARVADELRKAIAGVQLFDTQFKIIQKTGDIKTIKSKGFVNYDHSGKPISMMGVNWDVTETAEATEKLGKSEQLFRQIVETSQDGIWLHDGTNKTIFVNPRFTQIFGYTAEEMPYLNINDLIDPAFHNLVKEKTESRRKGNADSYELLCIRKTGQKIWIQVSASPILDKDGMYSGSLAMLSDISERKKEELEKEKITQDLIQRNKNMEQFSYI